MKVTHESLQKYVGGQMEIENRNEGYLYCGEIETITLTHENLRVRLKWNAKMDDDHNWVKDDKLDLEGDNGAICPRPGSTRAVY
jgi:hypothetical protein